MNIRWAGIAFLVATASGIANAQNVTGGGVIEGRISTADRSALAGANVRIVGTPAATVTDSTGRFVFASAPAGAHAIEITHLVHEPMQIVPVKMPVGADTMRIEAMLEPIPPVGSVGRGAGGRGAGVKPLVVLDGVLISTERPGGVADTAAASGTTQFTTVRIEVLTGAAAMQMFGSRAQYGVISITSKWVCPPGARTISQGCVRH